MAKYTLEFERPILDLEAKIAEMQSLAGTLAIDEEVTLLRTKVEQLRAEIHANLTRWQRVQLARHPERPYTLDYVAHICEDFIELHGDRLGADDKAIVGGLARIDGMNLVLIGQQKGHDTKENVERNFGMPNPEGYRKALRLMKLAEKFNLPLVTLIDTQGAYPGMEAEERGQAEAIARNLLEMARLRTPIVNIVIGEGASGGALGIGMGDRFLMMENTWFSVISPESCSSILWRSWDYKEQAAEALRLTPPDLVSMGIADGIIAEPVGGAHRDPAAAAQLLKAAILESLADISSLPIDALITRRHERYLNIGVWNNSTVAMTLEEA